MSQARQKKARPENPTGPSPPRIKAYLGCVGTVIFSDGRVPEPITRALAGEGTHIA